MKILDHGEVSLINMMGGDLAVVAAARVSNGITYQEASKGTEKDAGLINFLVKNRHGSPFEHSVFQFYVKAPIFVAREWFRHRMSSFNEISGRYVEYESEFYVPEKWRVPAATNKQGSVFPEESDQTTIWDGQMQQFVEEVTEDMYIRYQTLIEAGVAKEMARMILPQNLYTQFYYTVNARSLLNFLSLRNAIDAQFEIREYARAIEEVFFVGQMPLTHAAFLKNDRIAP